MMEKFVYLYNATVERVVDGDTVDFTIDFGMHRYEKHVRMRLVGPDGQWFDAYELRRGTDEERELGRKAADRIKELLPEGQHVVIRTYKPDARDSFGRWLAAIWVAKDWSEPDAATILVLEGLGFFDRKATGGGS